MSKIALPSGTYPSFVSLHDRVNKMLNKTVVTQVIGALRDDPTTAEWVNHGLNLHRGEHASTTCRFCNQPLPIERLQELEGHFNDEYSRFQDEVLTLIAEVETYQSQVKLPQFPDKGLLYPALRESYALQVQRCAQNANTTGIFLAVVKRALEAKQKEPFRALSIEQFYTAKSPDEGPSSGWTLLLQVVLTIGSGVGALTGKAAFDAACAAIKQHNEHSESFDNQQTEARLALEQDSVAEVLEDYRALLTAADSAKNQLSEANESRNKLKQQIVKLENSIRQHYPAADELSSDMASYLGRDELRFEARDGGYVITRHGQSAMHLSEGERTAISFMYFLKSLQDTNFDLKNGVVVIDDPVSSLDANSLYCAFGFMRSRIQDASQIFVLTHNFTFFRQVKNWFGHLNKKKKSASFYMLKSISTERGRSAVLTELDKLLHKYESEYHHIFQLVLDASQQAADVPMDRYYALPNIARRLLEAVLAFKQPGMTGELYQQLKDIAFDEAKKARIIRFTHTYSHHGLMPEPVHDLSILAETSSVMRDVLELIRYLDEEHYTSMESMCRLEAVVS